MDFSWQVGSDLPETPAAKQAPTPLAPFPRESATGEGGAPAAALAAAQAECARLTAEHSRSFSLGARLLPPAKRRAVHALYAFCRISDDLVDSPAASAADPAAAARALEAWRAYVLGLGELPALPLPAEQVQSVALAFNDALRRYLIPRQYAHALIDGVARDLHPRPIHTYQELADYAYGVAATVGLMSMHIIGYREPAPRFAAQLGQALQLINILRDVGEDLAAGRLYLPRVELAAFGLRGCDPFDESVEARELVTSALGEDGVVTSRWRAFMAFQVRRARALCGSALPGVAYLHPDGRLAVAAAALLYRAILDDIALHDYDVFTRRAHASQGAKVRALARAAAFTARLSLREKLHRPTRPAWQPSNVSTLKR
jgi:phytoene synthase